MTQAVIHEVANAGNKIAFTFDDGPNPIYTQEILNIFQEHQAKATFYTIGKQIELFPEIAKAIHQAGHELGNHTYTHPNLIDLTATEIRNELEQTAQIIESITGSKPKTFRPPYFGVNEEVASVVSEFGYPMAGAVNLAAEDWNEPGTAHIVAKTLEGVRGGGILIFHDGFGNRSGTVEAVRILVPKLIADGYELVRADELI